MVFHYAPMDVAPGPVETGLVALAALVVIALLVMLAAGVVLFLWLRKRRLRGMEMIRPDESPALTSQPNNPNQP